jgi:2-polyprenyl-3-methyl-5-hydroxy-6-metoxy-1,4-benzoquinol methylase
MRMQKAIDWLEMWRELVEVQEDAWRAGGATNREDVWRARAKAFDADVKRRWSKPDSSRDFITAQLRANPDWTALDIGGGTGAWAALMAGHSRHVTVIEPSPAMIEVMRKNLSESVLGDVEIVQEKWPEARVEKHDLTLCAHAMYGFPDFAKFIRSIEAVTRHLCVLIMRAPIPGDLLSIAAIRIWGHPYDSPDFQVAYNALLQMGIFPNVLMENTGLWDPWVSPSMDEALVEAKRKLGLSKKSEHDPFLQDLLARNLSFQDGRYHWPQGIRTALVCWSVDQKLP